MKWMMMKWMMMTKNARLLGAAVFACGKRRRTGVGAREFPHETI
jgi:hypothetical protein